MAATIKLTVNGKPRELHTDDPSMPLLYALRDELGLHGSSSSSATVGLAGAESHEVNLS